jgi:hypothetical protein
MSITSTSPRARWGKIATAVAEGPFSRSRLYELAAEHRGLFRKDGRSVVVDLELKDKIAAELPAATVKPIVRSRGSQ